MSARGPAFGGKPSRAQAAHTEEHLVTIVIRYTIEQTDAGWIVWRKVQEREPVGIPIASGSPRIRVHPSRRNAEEEIRSQKLADRAAATRLGVEVDHR
jgi:hypothetical protein